MISPLPIPPVCSIPDLAGLDGSHKVKKLHGSANPVYKIIPHILLTLSTAGSNSCKEDARTDKWVQVANGDLYPLRLLHVQPSSPSIREINSVLMG